METMVTKIEIQTAELSTIVDKAMTEALATELPKLVHEIAEECAQIAFDCGDGFSAGLSEAMGTAAYMVAQKICERFTKEYVRQRLAGK